MTTANILRIHLSSLKNNIDCTKQIKQKQSLLKKQIKLSQDINEATIPSKERNRPTAENNSSNNSSANSTEELQTINKGAKNRENINRRRTRSRIRGNEP
jgi:hypothetical protein